MMDAKTSYRGIDCFRLVAALLIVAIHTSPLLSFTDTGNFVLTRVVARVAVPFFFMTSGFFLISRYGSGTGRLRKFVLKTLAIYAAAIVICLPLNIYNGYFSAENSLPSFLRDLFFEGTLYHLWYLPASVVGGVIAWFAVRRYGYGKALAVTLVLYVIGLFGDSYYGLVEGLPGLDWFYNGVFTLTGYTRNGVFFAPVFFVLGGMAADGYIRVPAGKSTALCALSLAATAAEALLLRHFSLQRHDSMYVFLLPCSVFLFCALLHIRGKRSVFLRTSSLIVYVIHPLVIAAVRMAAKFTGTRDILVDNSLIHYAAVAAISVSVSAAAAAVYYRLRGYRSAVPAGTDRAWVEADLSNLEHNARVLQSLMPEGCKLMAVVKDEAYGHGAFDVSVHLNRIGVRAFAVATIDEGIALRKRAVSGDILIMGCTDPCRAGELRRYRLTQTLTDPDYALRLDARGVRLKAQVKVDTGMHRLGVSSEDIGGAEKMFKLRNIAVTGIYTHLCCSDSDAPEDVDFTRGQISRFFALIDALRARGVTVPKIHMQSSYGLLNYPDVRCDYARMGIALYGVLSSPGGNTVIRPDLRPVLSLKARVVLVRRIPAGDFVGYGRTFKAERDTVLAVIPVGYGDGFPRHLSCGKAYVSIRGQLAPVAGRICMDQFAVDVTDIPDVAAGDIAVLIGEPGDLPLSAPVVADSAGSISNELLCRMGSRLPVISVGGRTGTSVRS